MPLGECRLNSIRCDFLKEQAMKIILYLKIALIAILPSLAFSSVLDGQIYGGQIYDVQGNERDGVTTSTWSELADLVDGVTHVRYYPETGQYLSFFIATQAELDAIGMGSLPYENRYGMALYNADGALVRIVQRYGRFTVTSFDFMLYMGENIWGHGIWLNETPVVGNSYTYSGLTVVSSGLSVEYLNSISPFVSSSTRSRFR